MKPLFFFLLFLIFSPIASASLIERSFEIREVYFNTTAGGYISTHKEYRITLTPIPYNDFNNPGYYITEYLPRGFTFISTNADKYTLIDNKLQMLKFLPQNDNSSLTYKLQYKKDFDPIPSFYGTYLDENRNYGIITQQNGTVSSTTSIHNPTPAISYEKAKDIVPVVISVSSGFISSTSSPIQVIPYIPEESNGIGILVLLLILVVVFIILRPSYHKVFNVKILGSGDVVIDKKAVGITNELKFTLITKSPLSVKIIGDLSKIVTSIQEMPCDNRCFVITILPDGKERTGMIIFTKKNTKNMKYKVKKL